MLGPQQISRAHEIVRVHGMGDRMVGISVPLEPRARAVMERPARARGGPPQLRTRACRETARASGNAREPGRAGAAAGWPFKPPEHQRGPAPLEHGVAHRPRQLLEHRRPHRELDHVGGEHRQNLVAEVLGETMIVAAQTPTAAPSRRPARRVSTARPDTGPAGQPSVLRHERLHRGELEIEPGVSQQDRGFGGHHREVLDANLDQRTARAQPPERKRRLGPRADRDHRPGGHLLESTVERWRTPSAEARDVRRRGPAPRRAPHRRRRGSAWTCASRSSASQRVRVEPHELALDRARPTRTAGSTCRTPAGRRSPPSDRVRALERRRTSVAAPDQSVAGLRTPPAPAGLCGGSRRGERLGAGAAAGVIVRARPSSRRRCAREEPLRAARSGARRPTPVFEEARTTVWTHVRRPVTRPAGWAHHPDRTMNTDNDRDYRRLRG